MPVPMWIGKVNKRVFNPREIKNGERPVLTHVGRSSGTVYRTPLDAHPVDGGYIFIVMYGSESDWVKNIMAAGTVTLTVAGDEIDLTSPRLISKDEAFQVLAETTKAPPEILKVTEYLRMDAVA